MSENQSVIATCVAETRKDIAKAGKIGATSDRVALPDDSSNDIEAAAERAKVSIIKLQGILKTGRGNKKTKSRDCTLQIPHQDRSQIDEGTLSPNTHILTKASVGAVSKG